MRLRLSFGVAIFTVALAGCSLDPATTCKSKDDCAGGGRCDETTHTCVTAACNPACGFGEYCVTSTVTCEVAHTGSEVTAPVAGALIGKSATVHVRLKPAQEEAHEDPAEVTVTVTSLDLGGNVEVSLSKVSEAEYEGTWNPTASGQYSLAVTDEAYPSEPVEVKVDQTGPSFTVAVAPHAARPDAGTTTYTDVGMPQAYRRDELATVVVESADSDVDPASVRVSLTGTGAAWDSGVATQVTSGCDAGYCGTLEVPLWGPEMKAYHAVFHASASGADQFGNPSEGATVASFEVTRFKWTFTTPDGLEIGASPAIGRDGTVYVGTAVTSPAFAGSLYSVSPEGQKRWNVDAGAIEVSPAVGADAGGYEKIYFAETDGGAGVVVSLDSRKGQIADTCGIGRPQSAMSIAPTVYGGVSLEGAVLADSNPSLAAFRPGGGGASSRCSSVPLTPSSTPPGNVVASGSRFFVPSSGTAEISWTDFGDSGLGAAQTFACNTTPGSLALSGSRFLYSMTAGAGAINSDGSGFDGAALSGAPSWGPTISADGGFVGTSTGLVSLTLGSPLEATTNSAGAGSKASSVLGKGGWLYLSAGSGFQAWKQGGTAPVWEVADAGFSTADVGLTIDCTRDDSGAGLSRPGVVYVKTGVTKLSAIVVDSHGIDASAPWPKYQHDPRNTGNVDTPLTDFSCP